MDQVTPRRNRTLASVVVSAATLIAMVLPAGWLVLMSLPAGRETLVSAPGKYGFQPFAYWVMISVALFVTLTLIVLLSVFSVRALLGRTGSDRPLFAALLSVAAYLGTVALLGNVSGVANLCRATFTLCNIGWFFVMATGLPVWGPLLLWFFGTASRRP